MNLALIWSFILATLGVIISVFLPSYSEIFLYLGIASTIAVMSWYFYKLWFHNQKLSTFSIDSIYYLGFLITIITLVFTIIKIAHDPNILDNRTQIVTQFGAGLGFTGLALLFRLLLLGKHPDEDLSSVEHAEQLAEKLQQLTVKFDTLSNGIVKLSKAAETRSATVIEAFTKTETEFQTRLNTTATTFAQLVQASTAKLQQAETELEAAAQRGQAREHQLAAEFNAAIIAFKNRLDSAYQESLNASQAREEILHKGLANALEKFDAHLVQASTAILETTGQTISTANQQFAESVSVLTAETLRISTEAKAINFKQASQRLIELSSMLETTLQTITASTTQASNDTTAAMQILTTAADKTQAVALAIAGHLDALRNLETLVAYINQTASGLEQLSGQSGQSRAALAALAHESHDAAQAAAGFSATTQTATNSLDKLNRHTEQASALINGLNQAAQQTQTIAQTLSASLERLQNLEKLAALVEKTGHGLELVNSGATTSGNSLHALGDHAETAASASDTLSQRLNNAADSFLPIIKSNQQTSMAVEKLAETVTKTHTIVAQINTALNNLSISAPEPRPKPSAKPTPTKPKPWYKMTMTETWQFLRGKRG